jgi:hypothetical protein
MATVEVVGLLLSEAVADWPSDWAAVGDANATPLDVQPVAASAQEAIGAASPSDGATNLPQEGVPPPAVLTDLALGDLDFAPLGAPLLNELALILIASKRVR